MVLFPLTDLQAPQPSKVLVRRLQQLVRLVVEVRPPLVVDPGGLEQAADAGGLVGGRGIRVAEVHGTRIADLQVERGGGEGGEGERKM